MRPFEQPLPEWIRVAHDFDWATSRALRIVHVGQSGTVLAGPGESRRTLVVVTWGDRGLVPGGIQVPDSFATTHLLGHVRLADRAGLMVDLRAWRDLHFDRRTVVDLRLPHLAVDSAAVHRCHELLLTVDEAWLADTAMDPNRQRALAPALAQTIVAGEATATNNLVQQLIGAGPGSTPAGDDVLVGVLAGASLATCNGLLDHRAQQAHESVRRSVIRLLDRTTAASRHELGAALNGCFSQRFLYLAAALGDPAAVPDAYRAARGWGATSGIDLLHGLVAMAAASLDQPALLHRTA